MGFAGYYEQGYGVRVLLRREINFLACACLTSLEDFFLTLQQDAKPISPFLRLSLNIFSRVRDFCFADGELAIKSTQRSRYAAGPQEDFEDRFRGGVSRMVSH